MPADLHLHSTASDGTLSPEEIVAEAAALGLTTIAITDHDTMDGINSALIAGKKHNVKVIPGIEINTEWKGLEVHILGYYPDMFHPQFADMLLTLQAARRERVIKTIEKLQRNGIDIDISDILAEAGGRCLGRPHIARALIKKGYASTQREAFELYIGPEAPAYVPRFKLSPEQAISIIIQAGGVPVLAHPGVLARDDIIYYLLKHGLMGVEVFHPDHNARQIQIYLKIARKLDLLITGGSDCHGPRGKKRGLMGKVRLSTRYVEELNSAIKNNPTIMLPECKL
ncbi:hypothetical protein SAMN02745885_00248 [Carboxydocella sporoproducens DSM 16521]|uniref:Polymerase/histidinol phosphatase N-terminal domain-containing protein n=2 Tax=Carboxydocella TaxID=178898 RepID=A0A1T4LQ79_9FIRM|nr:MULTISPECIES: PHP domain-containing protein [Carboxydocella]AVX20558.1 hypothetical protein CFE_1369 [Carboxydocella thermautotrophica]AVX30980.1 hypothetical protein CTH_1390 [Carboxydocella thermautotrophica]GAW29624.1 phosphatase [Carboxydocella sp. ULO1]SJZ56786.1 hypothetical protein SAMN02745885_00248 [Carboxydocella sporoproducens DSM 16521]